MQRDKQKALRAVIRAEFDKGINKADLFHAVETFIDNNFLQRKESLESKKDRQILEQLITDIRKAGSLREWKQGLSLQKKQ